MQGIFFKIYKISALLESLIFICDYFFRFSSKKNIPFIFLVFPLLKKKFKFY